MKLTALVPLPHGLHHLKIGDSFEEPDETRANMLVYLQRAEKAKPKVAAPAVVPVPVEPPAPVAQTYQTKVAQAEAPQVSGEVEPMKTKRTYTRRDLTSEK